MNGNALASIFSVFLLNLPSFDTAVANEKRAYSESRTAEKWLGRIQYTQQAPEAKPAKTPSATSHGWTVQGGKQDRPSIIMMPCLYNESSSKCQGMQESRPPEKKDNSDKKHLMPG